MKCFFCSPGTKNPDDLKHISILWIAIRHNSGFGGKCLLLWNDNEENDNGNEIF